MIRRDVYTEAVLCVVVPLHLIGEGHVVPPDGDPFYSLLEASVVAAYWSRACHYPAGSFLRLVTAAIPAEARGQALSEVAYDPTPVTQGDLTKWNW